MVRVMVTHSVKPPNSNCAFVSLIAAQRLYHADIRTSCGFSNAYSANNASKASIRLQELETPSLTSRFYVCQHRFTSLSQIKRDRRTQSLETSLSRVDDLAPRRCEICLIFDATVFQGKVTMKFDLDVLESCNAAEQAVRSSIAIAGWLWSLNTVMTAFFDLHWCMASLCLASMHFFVYWQTDTR